jgi:hypothetical protein
MVFEDFLDAKRVLGVLGRRFARYGLSLHPDKTRFVDFRSNRPGIVKHGSSWREELAAGKSRLHRLSNRN